MKLFCVCVMVTWFIPTFATASACKTVENIEYRCSDATDMLQSILSLMSPVKSTVYIFDGIDKVLRHIVRYDLPGEGISDTYFQDYIYNTSRNFFHLVHFVKNSKGTYDVYIETDVRPTGVFKEDIKHVTYRVRRLGVSEDLTFDDEGYPSSTLRTSTGTNLLSSNRSGLTFSVVGGVSETYYLAYSLVLSPN